MTTKLYLFVALIACAFQNNVIAQTKSNAPAGKGSTTVKGSTNTVTPKTSQEGMQSDAKATEVLTASQKKIAAIKQMTVNFTQTLTFTGKESTAKPVNGAMKLKGEKFNVTLEDVQIICDGKTQWNYLKKDKEVTVSNYDKNEGFSPNQIFKISQKEMKAKYEKEEMVGAKKLHKLLLFPISAANDYYKIELWIDATDKLPYKIKIWSRKQSSTTYEISKMDVATPLEDAAFTFDAKSAPGVEVIDNR